MTGTLKTCFRWSLNYALTGTGAVSGPTALSGKTSVGEVQGGSYEVQNKGDRVVIKGGVHARLNQH